MRAGQKEAEMIADFGVSTVPAFFMYLPGLAPPQAVNWTTSSQFTGQWPFPAKMWINCFDETIKTAIPQIKFQANRGNIEAQRFLRSRQIEWE